MKRGDHDSTNKTVRRQDLGWFYKLALLDFELIFEPKTEQAECNQTCLNC